MARVKLDFPGEAIFTTVVEVRIDDINYGGHLSNDRVLSIMHEARLRFLKNYGYTELEVGGVSLIMADAALVFKSEGFHGDLVVIEMTIGEFSGSGFELYYKLSNKESGKEIALGKTGMVCFDYENRKVARVPEGFLTTFDH